MGNQMVKFMVFVANLLIFIFGGLLFGFSLWVSWQVLLLPSHANIDFLQAQLDNNFPAHLREFAQKVQIDPVLIEEVAQV